jgi:hypothetical protein
MLASPTPATPGVDKEKPCPASAMREPDDQAMVPAELLAEAGDCRDQSECLELRRVQAVGDPMDVRGDVAGGARQLVTSLPAGVIPAAVHGELLELHGQQRQPLADVVMEIAGNAPPFFLLRRNQSPRHLARRDENATGCVGDVGQRAPPQCPAYAETACVSMQFRKL